MKGGCEHRVPLSERALETLGGTPSPRMARGRNSSKTPLGPICSPHWKSLAKRRLNCRMRWSETFPNSTSGTVTGMITGGNVVGPAAQGIAASNFDGLVTAITSEASYANMHTANFPAREIRGQILEGKAKKIK